MLPQVGVGGWTPNPRKLNPDSVMMELATRRVAATMIGLAALGSICRTMIRPWPAPRAFAASTNTCSFNERNDARTSRATVIQDSKAIASTMASTPPRRNGTGKLRSSRIRMISKKSAGIDSIKSVNRISRLSVAPP